MRATFSLWKPANIIVIAFQYVLVAHILHRVQDLPHVLLVFWLKGVDEWVDAPSNFAARVVVVTSMDSSVTTL